MGIWTWLVWVFGHGHLVCVRERWRECASSLLERLRQRERVSSGIFPNIWNQGLITPIHKIGDKFDPNNYRKICLSSNLVKILCSTIISRLQHFLSENNVLSKCQIGFLPKYHMTDHVYSLHTLIDKQAKQKQSLLMLCIFKKNF